MACRLVSVFFAAVAVAIGIEVVASVETVCDGADENRVGAFEVSFLQTHYSVAATQQGKFAREGQPVNISEEFLFVNEVVVKNLSSEAKNYPLLSEAPPFVLTNFSAAASHPSEGPVTTISYHKAGFEFSTGYAYHRSRMTGERFIYCFYCFIDSPCNCSDPDRYHNGDLVVEDTPQAGWKLPANGPAIHFIRDPVRLIASAYRYHLQSPEGWTLRPREGLECHRWGQRCHSAPVEDLIFGVCDDRLLNCSYFDVLNSLNETTGVLVETINEIYSLQTMFQHMLEWESDPHVLHLSMEHVEENFDQTMACMNTFLANRGLSQADLYNISQPGQAHYPLQIAPDHQHSTSARYDNAIIKEWLEQKSVWGQEFAKTREMINSINQRQATLYGCPIPTL